MGGEFTALVTGQNFLPNYSSKATATVSVNGKNQTGFETFCVEINQNFTPNTSYNTVLAPTINNGTGSSAVTVGSAYLYSQFAQGKLSGYDYTTGSGRETTSDELQDALWYLQGNIINGYRSGSSSLYTFNANTDPFLVLVDSLFGTKIADESDLLYGNNFGVMVLNLTSTVNSCTVYNQDQLVYCPVPEPATLAAGVMLLLPLGWSAFRALRNKKATRIPSWF